MRQRPALGPDPHIASHSGARFVAVIGALVIEVILVSTAGMLGLGVSAMVFGSIFFLPIPVAFVVSQLALLVALPASTFTETVAIEAGLVVILLAPTAPLADGWRIAGPLVVWGLGLGGLVIGGLSGADSLWQWALALGVVYVVLAYAIHRYERTGLRRAGVDG